MDILLIEDHAVVAEGVSSILPEGYRLKHWAADGEKGLAWLQSNTARLVIVDLKMPGIGGIETIRRLRRHYPHIGVLVFSSMVEPQVARWLMEQGVRVIVDKAVCAADLAEALGCAAAQTPYLSRAIAQAQLLTQSPIDCLTQREYQVLNYLMTGMRHREIAEQLFISHKTVSTYRQRAMDKLGLDTDLELAKFALQQGWIEASSV
ncbi:response regulator [Litorivicinus lipolyticus]|uniref:Response regulator n=1 Tax=Litorivicinus lipolyticus TaxID=418701 RepID=A0A5Q2QB88_9GAMM|nr:response regulator transcription factor [Litorivicinus lipolyticus]QGG80344.1 response regulator [Litorivicinus lipolyticus]